MSRAGWRGLALVALVAFGCGGGGAEREGSGADSVGAAAAPGRARLHGVLTAADTTPPVAGTVLQVLLTEAAFSGTAYTRIADRQFDVSGASWPIPFAIEYDPAAVDPNKTYVVWAMLVVGQRPVLEQDRFVRVLTQGAPTDSVVVPLVSPGTKSQLLPDAEESAVPGGR